MRDESRQANPREPAPASVTPRGTHRVMTIPNVLCFIRLVGAPALVWLAWQDRPWWFVGWFVFLAATDWVDGKLAVFLDQRTVLGARLDSLADATLYASLTVGGLWLGGRDVWNEWPWIAAAIGSFVIALAAGLIRYGKAPSYHTRSAKISWMLVLVGATCLFVGWPLWPFRLAMVFVTLTNLESLAMTCMLRSWRADISSFWKARQLRLAGHDLPPPRHPGQSVRSESPAGAAPRP